MREHAVTIDGIDVHVQHGGRGRPVLFVHGLGGASTSWQPHLEALAENRRVIAPDLPGFGRSAKPEAAFTPAFFVDVLVDLLDQLGVDETDLVASSMGGQVAIELALRHPDRVRRAVAIAPAGVPPARFEGTPELARYRDIVHAETEEEVTRVLEAVRPDELPPPEHGRDPAEILAYVHDPGAERAFQRALTASAEARRLGPLLDDVEAPLWIVWGTRDPMIPWDVAGPVVQQATSPGLITVEGAGHSPHNEDLATFQPLLEAILAGEVSASVPAEEVQIRSVPAEHRG